MLVSVVDSVEHILHILNWSGLVMYWVCIYGWNQRHLSSVRAKKSFRIWCGPPNKSCICTFMRKGIWLISMSTFASFSLLLVLVAIKNCSMPNIAFDKLNLFARIVDERQIQVKRACRLISARSHTLA
jgi:hypothetical protein